jgi:large subunit ribosomal protein L24
MPRHVKKGDVVEVIAGDHKGETGKILRVDTKRDRVVVEGVNMIYRHVRPSRRNPQGGRVRRGAIVSKRRVTVHGTVLGEVTRSTEESAAPKAAKKGGASR